MKSCVESYSFTGLDDVNQDIVVTEKINDDINISILIDGMGAYKESGNIAQLISKVLLTEIKNNTDINYNKLLIKAIESANIATREFLNRHRCKAGATLAIFIKHKSIAHISWLGDVRVYSLKDSRLTLLTDDHKVDAHLISRSINGKEFNQDPPYRAFKILSGDQFILCSDGIYNTLSNEQIISLRDNLEHYSSMQFSDDASIIYVRCL